VLTAADLSDAAAGYARRDIDLRSCSSASDASSWPFDCQPSWHVPAELVRRFRITQTELAPMNRSGRCPASHRTPGSERPPASKRSATVEWSSSRRLSEGSAVRCVRLVRRTLSTRRAGCRKPDDDAIVVGMSSSRNYSTAYVKPFAFVTTVDAPKRRTSSGSADSSCFTRSGTRRGYCGVVPNASTPVHIEPSGMVKYASGTDCPTVIIDLLAVLRELVTSFEAYTSELKDRDVQHDALRVRFKKKFSSSFGVDVSAAG